MILMIKSDYKESLIIASPLRWLEEGAWVIVVI
jgi:hypothetical protein